MPGNGGNPPFPHAGREAPPHPPTGPELAGISASIGPAPTKIGATSPEKFRQPPRADPLDTPADRPREYTPPILFEMGSAELRMVGENTSGGYFDKPPRRPF